MNRSFAWLALGAAGLSSAVYLLVRPPSPATGRRRPDLRSGVRGPTAVISRDRRAPRDPSGDDERARAARLIGELGQSDPRRIVAAARALPSRGDAAERAVPVLVELLGHSTAGVAAAASDALVRIGRHAVVVLADALSDPDARVREGASHILERIGRDLSRRSAHLARRLAAAGEEPRIEAAVGLDRIATACGRVVGPALSSGRGGLLRAVLDPLVAAVPSLVGALADDRRIVRAFCGEALRQVAQAAERTARGLVRVLGEGKGDAPDRRAALETLAWLLEATGRGAAHLVRLETHPSADVRTAVAEAIGRVRQLHAEGAAALREAGRKTPPVPQVEPLLRRLGADRNPAVREAAQEAMERLKRQ